MHKISLTIKVLAGFIWAIVVVAMLALAAILMPAQAASGPGYTQPYEITLTATGSGYYKLYDFNGVFLSNHVTERKAIQKCVNFMISKLEHCTIVHDYRVTGNIKVNGELVPITGSVQ